VIAVNTQPTTSLERTSLEAHVDLCALRYQNVDERLNIIENKVTALHQEVASGNKSMIKVLIGTAGTVIAGLLSTIVVILIAL
jgi:tetrahydromethanopterin S-methyltransferase subunit G